MISPPIPFESTAETYRAGEFLCFRVGTCEGLWRSTSEAYEILAVVNHKRGNGHFKEAMLWFEQSCRRDRKALLVREIWNPRLAFMLRRNGFKWDGWFNWRKTFL
jgi:hypothetical protein